MASDVWNEHNDDGVDSASDPDQSLSAVAEDAVVNEELGSTEFQDAPKKKSGLSPRLLFVIFALVAVSVSGFMFLKMVKRPAATESSEVVNAPAAPVAAPSGQEGAAIIPGAVELPPGGSAMSGGMMAGAAPEAAPPFPGMPSDPIAQATSASPAEVAPSSGALPMGAPHEPVTAFPDRSGEVADLRMQLDSLRGRLANAEGELTQANARLAESSAAESRAAQAKAAAKPGNASQKETRVASAESAPRRVAAKSVQPARARSVPVITEAKESNIGNISIRAIYPTSGKNPQAWVTVDGTLVEVTVGSVIGGAKIREIKPASMEIITDAGVIHARRQP